MKLQNGTWNAKESDSRNLDSTIPGDDSMNTVSSESARRFTDMSTGQCGVVINGPPGRAGRHFIKTFSGVTFLDDGSYYASCCLDYSEHTVRRVRKVTIKC